LIDSGLMLVHRMNAVALRELLSGWSGRGPAYRDLTQALRQLILDGRLPLDVRLPGERDLAAALAISRTTVTAAYTALRDEGFMLTQHGSRAITAVPPGAPPRQTALSGDPLGGDLLDLAFSTLPAPEGVLHQAYAAAMEALPAYLPTHGYASLGLPVLREAVASRYRRHGLPTDAGQIIVTFGALHALSLLVRALTSPGDRVLVDQPSYLHALDTFRQAGCQTVPVALTEEGWDVAGLCAAIRQTAPRLAYLIPDFHNPTGWCMPQAQRAVVARAAHESRTTLIVDETLAELALDGPVPLPFALQGGQGEVISIGSLSKSFWGGLRIGWIRAPGPLVARLAGARAALDLGAPVLEQLAAAQLLADPTSVLAARRATLRHQRAALMHALAEHLPEWRYHLPAGGLSLWVSLPDPLSSALAVTSTRFGVRVLAGSHFGRAGLFERQLRLPFTLPEAELGKAVRRLARAYRALGGSSETPSVATRMEIAGV
jgi:DNA-binding transcriptional MocR family regulator